MKPQFTVALLLFTFTFLPFAAVADTGDIQGTVYQRSTGAALAGADVHILETDQRQRTDANGVFRFTALPAGTYTFRITHRLETGPTDVSAAISSGDTTELTIHLGASVKLEAVQVEGKRLPRTVSRTEVRGSDLLRIPGTFNDTLKGLMTLPSIGVPNDYFGALYIRGSEPGANLYYLDRTPLGYPFHWGGLLSTLSSETLERIDIYAGGYGAEFGLDSQTVLDIYARNTAEKRWRGKFNLNLLYSEGLLETNIGDKGYLSVSGRRSYFDLIAGPIIESQTGTSQQLPYLADYQLKGTYQLTPKHRLTVNAFAAVDRVRIFSEGPEQLEGEVEAEWRDAFLFENGFNGQGVHLRSDLTENLSSDLSLTRSENFLNIDLTGPTEERYTVAADGSRTDYLANTFTYQIAVNAPVYALREDIVYQAHPKLRLESGLLWNFTPARSSEKSWVEENFEVEEIPEDDVERYDVEVDEEPPFFEEVDDAFGHDFYRTEAYVQGRYDPMSFLSVALGVRFDYLNVTEEVSIQPRGSVSLELPNGSDLRFAYGHYEQSPQPTQLLAADGNRDLESTLTRHYILELTHELSERTEFKCAAYYKQASRLVTPDETLNYLNQGSGSVSGAEAFLRHRIPERFFGWVSYAYTHAERRERPGAPSLPHLFENTSIISVVANYNLTSKCEIGAKWQYLSGTAEAPISSIVLIQDPVTRGFNPLLASVDEQLTTELTPYHKLDFRISYLWTLWGSEVGGFIDILNVYNRENKMTFVFEEATLDVQGQEIAVEREVFEAPQLPRIIYFGLTLEM